MRLRVRVFECSSRCDKCNNKIGDMRQIRGPVSALCALLMKMEWNEPDFASFQRQTEDNDDTSFQIEFRLILNAK